jgi:hypothetical protein
MDLGRNDGRRELSNGGGSDSENAGQHDNLGGESGGRVHSEACITLQWKIGKGFFNA